jgi:FeS assembly SUF system regulator
MIRMTKQADYGFVLLSRLAAPDGEVDRVANAPELAGETRLPLPMVSKILKLLARGGVVRSHRGVKGGYSLARPAAEISAADIVRALEGPVALTVCIEGSPGECELEPFCQVRGHWQQINVAIEQALARISLAELAGPLGPPAGERLIRLGRGTRPGSPAAPAAS